MSSRFWPLITRLVLSASLVACGSNHRGASDERADRDDAGVDMDDDSSSVEGVCEHDNGGCDPLVTCTQRGGHAECGACPEGYAGDGKGCTDIDECAIDHGGCDPLVTCTDQPAGAAPSCGACPDGYEGSGESACLPLWSALTSGWLHVCALQQDGKAACWGKSEDGQVGDGTLEDRHAPTAVLGGHELDMIDAGPRSRQTCGIEDGALYCWPRLSVEGVPEVELGPQQVGSDRDWRTVALGGRHWCAIKTDGRLFCWGHQNHGQLGNGVIADATLDVPTQVGSDTDWESVDAGGSNTCAIKTDGTLRCWGWNEQGQCGVPGQANWSKPQQVGSAGRWKSSATGLHESCAVDKEGKLFCWGRIAPGISEEPNVDDLPAPILAPAQLGLDEDWAGVTVGLGDHVHLCAIKRDRSLYCWGPNGEGNVGDGTNELRETPTAVAGGYEWLAVVAGDGYSCGLTVEHQVLCWGTDVNGQVGDGRPDLRDAPQLLDEGPWSSVVAGDAHACALEDGRLFCNGAGQPGAGAEQGGGELTEVGAGGWAHVSASGNTTCATSGDGDLLCWGDNVFIGYGFLAEPTLLESDLAWEQVETSRGHGCGLTTGGTLHCWGANDQGQLGNGLTARSAIPVQVGSDDDWLTFDAGSSHTCGIKEGGSLYCWGGGYGSAPVLLAGDDWAQVATGRASACGITESGALYCWESSGELATAPTQVGARRDFREVSSTDSHTCATTTSGELYCWGANRYGQLGDLTVLDRAEPTEIGMGAKWSRAAAGRTLSCALDEAGALHCWGDGEDGKVDLPDRQLLPTPIAPPRGIMVGSGG